MQAPHRRQAGRLLVSLATCAGLVVSGAIPVAAEPLGQRLAESAAPAAQRAALPGAAVGSEIAFTGHGWGHGRGMGQYGALGYAVNSGWGYRAILGHYYGNTTVGSVADQSINVELLVHDQRNWVIVAGNNLRLNGADVAGAGLDVLLVEKVGAGNAYRVSKGTGCESASWTPIGTTYTGPITLSVPTQSGHENLVRTCEAGNTMRAYRGSIVVQNYGTSTTRAVVLNRVGLEDYLRGVVPRESPDSWGSLGGGRGMQALRAQTVAARSYALAGGLRTSGAKTCDTTACQVYQGAAELRWSGSGYALSKTLDGPNANAAIAATTGEVRLLNGAVARTEFSSSTGGYTAGGTFPAVVDAGDAISNNPNHNWSTTISTGTVASKLGVNGIRSIAVTGRNGLGADGGRVTQVTVVDSTGAGRTFTGDQVRSRLGLKSDWFSIATVATSEAEALVKALYADLLGRGPDPTGMSTWTRTLLAGTSQSSLVATLTKSDEYINRRIRQAYVEVLGRQPEAAGAAGWLTAIKAGRTTVDDVQRVFYDSVEYYQISGGTPSGYVARLYTTMLGRSASQAEIAMWVDVYHVRGRAFVVDSIWWSMEAAQRRAGAYYHTFLSRAPDRAGVESWARVLLSQGEGAVRQGIAGSQEYKQRAQIRYP